MLVDSHCHLDFPDFAEERADVVARAVAAGVARMVTISTRVRRFSQILDIAEAHDEVFCSVGTHPHNAAEELDVTADELGSEKAALKLPAHMLLAIGIMSNNRSPSTAIPVHGRQAARALLRKI